MADEATPEPQAAPEPAAAEPATTDAFGTPEAPAEPASPPNVADALAQLNSRFDAIEGRLPEQAPEPQVDPWEVLNNPEPEQPVYEEPAYEQPQVQQPQTEDDRLVAEFNNLVDQRVNQIVQPRFQQEEMGRRKAAIDTLSEKYPDFAEAIPEIGREMDQLAKQYGQPEIATDPVLAERLYQARKAVAVAAGETPAEAAGQGAHLETGAGNGTGQEEPSLQEQYLGPIMATVNQGGDAFT
jgi:hypothetical protein